MLFAAYRSLGGAPARAADSGALLSSANTALRGALTELSAVADAASSATPATTETARDGRRAGAAAQAMLDRLPTGADLDDRQQSVRALLIAAAEDTAWAWRMIAAGATSPGVTAAVVALRDHAAQCCDEADALLPVAPGAEPADRP